MSDRTTRVVRAGVGQKGAILDVVSGIINESHILGRVFDPQGEAELALEVLLELPVETRRALYLLVTGEFADGFNAAPKKEPERVYLTPPKPRVPQ